MDGNVERFSVLLIEDSEDDRFFFEHSFERAELNARLFCASDGFEAIEFLKQAMEDPHEGRFPRFIFLDLKMPDCDGFDVLRWMKENDLLDKTEVFVLSGSSEPQDIQLANELGARDYLVKPIRYHQIQQLVGSGERARKTGQSPKA